MPVKANQKQIFSNSPPSETQLTLKKEGLQIYTPRVAHILTSIQQLKKHTVLSPAEP